MPLVMGVMFLRVWVEHPATSAILPFANPVDPAPVYDGLRTVFPSCYCYLVGTPELSFVGASPELLVRRDGARAQTVALAGTIIGYVLTIGYILLIVGTVVFYALLVGAASSGAFSSSP